MKKSNFKLLCLVVMLLAMICAAVFTGCDGGDSTASGIAVKNTDLPRVNYVLGQELDLSNGVITVITDGKESSVPMTAEGVSVTGYDKDVPGKQTLTVTYKGQSTTFEVTVVAPALPIEYKENYFVGDKFDASQGRVKITNEDGSTAYYAFNSENVTVKSFDSSVAGDFTVVLVCVRENGETVEEVT